MLGGANAKESPRWNGSTHGWQLRQKNEKAAAPCCSPHQLLAVAAASMRWGRVLACSKHPDRIKAIELY